MTRKILIAGAGQLGSRYLQGLAKCRFPLEIYVRDVYNESLARAEQRWNEMLGAETQHEVSFHKSFDSLPQQLDIAIVATNADVRPHVVGEIASLSAVRYWVLEKVLAQSESGLDEIVSNTRNSLGAWVNTPRRMMPYHEQIKSQLGLKQPMTLEVQGGLWGLACNAVHFLDLFTWWSGETLQAVNTDRLAPHFFESKRPGNWEILGTLEARFSGGGHVLLSAKEDGGFTSIRVSHGQLSWLIKESDGSAERTDGMVISGRMVNQSEMTATLVESILENGSCDLPTLNDSAELHRVFIMSMLEHWRHAGNPAAALLPIT